MPGSGNPTHQLPDQHALGWPECRSGEQKHGSGTLEGRDDRRVRLFPRDFPVTLMRGLQAVRIIQGQHLRLCKGIGGAEAEAAVVGRVIGRFHDFGHVRVERIAFDLGRAAHVAFYQQARGRAIVHHRRGVIQRLARHDLFRCPHEGHDLFRRLLHAALHASQRK